MRKQSGVLQRVIRGKKGQTAIEYVITAGALFGAFLAFYALYSNLVPQQFDQGAKVILSVYDTGN
ncbi:hypothetical protein [Candidatus Avelusimicrobium facis]|uniref:hypothetical protein n=1 Tax=Candidatus Avelusimicrobium facis TaxID=3416203 RepID=UPI0015B48FCD